ncbi:MAG: SPASM domain-containing protein [Bacteroidales bacterium]|nr:SPASM domain-containing protein [Bacteroidales bacterium]
MNRSLWWFYFRNLTFYRAINSFQVLFSFVFSFITKKVIVWGQPIVFSIEPSAVCQLSCPECICGQGKLIRKCSFIDVLAFEKTINQIKQKSSIVNLFFQGEPFLHPQILDLIKIIKNAGLVTVISSNAQMIDEKMAINIVLSGLDMLIVSMDGASQDTYEKYRKLGDFNKLQTAMSALNDSKIQLNSNISLIAQCLLTKDTEPEIEKLKNWSAENGFTFIIKSMQIYNTENSQNFLPINKKYNRYASQNKRAKSCIRLWTHILVLTDGRVVPCCMDKNAEFAIDSAFDSTIQKLIKNEKRKLFMSKVLKNKNKVELCKNCHF